ncbi:MAG: hypothetical protein OXF99_04825 [bacterium]|nr:hypothetical protein [bacterium]
MDPYILIVDDEPERQGGLSVLEFGQSGVETGIYHPQEIKEEDLRRASVIAVDHFLENWSELDRQTPALRPRNGFALAAVFRSQTLDRNPSPAIVIRTAKLLEIAEGIPVSSAEHLLAWQHNIEWVLPKAESEEGQSEASRLTELARAVAELEDLWAESLSVTTLATEWFGLGDQEWDEVAQRHIVETRPPLHSVAKQTHGASVMRWFLHRVLPYPTFLIDEWRVATRLGVTQRWLLEVLNGESELQQKLDACSYSGVLKTFAGRRWWRAGLAFLVADATDGKPFNQTLLSHSLASLSGTEPELLREQRPVLALDPETLKATVVIEADDAVRVAPDGWPVFADDAWASRDDLSDDVYLAGLVLDPLDLSLEKEHS